MNDSRAIPLKFRPKRMAGLRILPTARVAGLFRKRREHGALTGFHFFARFAESLGPRCRRFRRMLGNNLFPILFVDLRFRNLKSDMARKTRRKKSGKGRIRRGEQVTPERLMELSFAYAPPLIISAGVSNQVFDSLEDGAKTPEQVAEKTGASARALRILMNALVGLDLLKKDRQGKYSLTHESAAFLVSSKLGTHAGFFGTIAPQIIARWLRLSDIVREGRPTVAVNQETEGTEFFSQLVENI